MYPVTLPPSPGFLKCFAETLWGAQGFLGYKLPILSGFVINCSLLSICRIFLEDARIDPLQPLTGGIVQGAGESLVWQLPFSHFTDGPHWASFYSLSKFCAFSLQCILSTSQLADIWGFPFLFHPSSLAEMPLTPQNSSSSPRKKSSPLPLNILWHLGPVLILYSTLEPSVCN